MNSVEIVEVAPRDGFQAIRPIIPSEDKVRVISALLDCNLKRIEVGAFVSKTAIPQMSDIGKVMKLLNFADDVRPAVLVPNRKGFELALECGFRDIVYVISVSESHNKNNVRRSTSQSFADLADVWRELGSADVSLRLNLATCFDCPTEGRIAEADVVSAIERALEIAEDVEIGICDTTGRAAPDHVQSLFGTLYGEFSMPGLNFAFHGHDTYGFGIANALAAYNAGVRIFDASAGGLGGCPFAPGASGNTATEDLIFAFEHMGIETGIDLSELLNAAELAATLDPSQASGKIRFLPRDRVMRGLAGKPADAA